MKRTAVAPGSRRAGLPGGRVLVLLATLAGLFAMHGMSDHGTMHHGSLETHAPAAPVEAVDLAPASHAMAGDGHGAAAVSEIVGLTGAAVVALGAAASNGALDAGLHAALGLCLAILAGAAIMALRRLRTWSSPLTDTLGDAGRLVLPSRARAPDPPDLYALSIQRC